MTKCAACSAPSEVCEAHCVDCGIAWQPGFVKVVTDPEWSTTLYLFCPTCWDNALVQ